MIVNVFRSTKVRKNDDLFEIIKSSISKMEEKDILVIASKVVSLCEGNAIKIDKNTKEERNEIVKKIADLYIKPHLNDFRIMLTKKNNWITVDAGVDVSNADGNYVLWPKNPQESANKIWRFLKDHYKLKSVGVVIADSNCVPLHWSLVGISLSYCGFNPLKNYVGTKDLFDWTMYDAVVNSSHGIAAAAVLEMGEGNEQTPFAIVKDVKRMVFQDREPTNKELSRLKIPIEKDIFAPLITKGDWKKGKS